MRRDLSKLLKFLASAGVSLSVISRLANRAGMATQAWLHKLTDVFEGRVSGIGRRELLRKLAAIPGVAESERLRRFLLGTVREEKIAITESGLPAPLVNAVERFIKTSQRNAATRVTAPVDRSEVDRPPRRLGDGKYPLPPQSRLPASSSFNPNFEPPREGETSPLTEEIYCGDQSSNVYSFGFDYESGTLFVTYLGHKLRAGSIRHGRRKLGTATSRPQLIGELGKTVTNERGGRGSLYAYYDVPVRVFERMKLAASKGEFVWKELRVKGSIYGHHYRYSLLQGQVSTQKGIAGVYIPRKATKEGFRTRSVADLGTGRRGFQTSTLPQQEGFRTRPPGSYQFGPQKKGS